MIYSGVFGIDVGQYSVRDIGMFSSFCFFECVCVEFFCMLFYGILIIFFKRVELVCWVIFYFIYWLGSFGVVDLFQEIFVEVKLIYIWDFIEDLGYSV